MDAKEQQGKLGVIPKRGGGCRDCALYKGTTNGVPGEGAADADIMFVGEGPGFYEDKQGRPFVGAAGKVLHQLLASIGLDREKGVIPDIVKHPPPNNRDPPPGENQTCTKHPQEQIVGIPPTSNVPL